jgi:phosphatidylserine decarboxylase
MVVDGNSRQDREIHVITRYGYSTVALSAVLCAAGLVVTGLFVGPVWAKTLLAVALLGFFAFVLNFFRDPERTTPPGDNLVIAPADGKIVLVSEVQDEEFMKDRAIQVSIFMSPLNVHVNRYPVNGTVAYYRYIPGEYLVAFDDKSSLRNERTHIGITASGFRVFFKQIAGFVARRIIAEVREGDNVKAGVRFGMIRFGSRVDVLVPKDAEVRVKTGDRTVAGSTVLAIVPAG